MAMLDAWVDACPDPVTFARKTAASVLQWMPTSCAGCGKDSIYSMLRVDRAAKTNRLICLPCYEKHMRADSEPWPVVFDPFASPFPLYGELVSCATGLRVGNVTHYNPDTRIGRVCLDHTDKSPVYGPVDPDVYRVHRLGRMSREVYGEEALYGHQVMLARILETIACELKIPPQRVGNGERFERISL